jgi:hypothetical protein
MSGSAGEDEDDAARAFENLREEVTKLRQGIDLVYKQGQDAKSVDYSLTLGSMAKSLQAVQGRLEAIESKPALAMTPEVYRERIEAMGQVAGQVSGRALSEGAAAQSEATRELKEILGRARSKRGQQEWLVVVGVLGVMVGMLLWTLLVENLPWGAGTWLAAVPIAGNKWDAGLELLREASPASYEKMTTLYSTCGEQPVAFCQEAIAAKTVNSARQTGTAPVEPRHETRP